MNYLKNNKQRKLQSDKCKLSNVKYLNPKEAANLYVYNKSQPITKHKKTFIITVYEDL
jgi:hypothetical protein